jgi:hypothetical protein
MAASYTHEGATLSLNDTEGALRHAFGAAAILKGPKNNGGLFFHTEEITLSLNLTLPGSTEQGP